MDGRVAALTRDLSYCQGYLACLVHLPSLSVDPFTTLHRHEQILPGLLTIYSALPFRPFPIVRATALSQHCSFLQERLGTAQVCSSSSEPELELLHCQLAQAEAALHSERQRSAELQSQVEASQGCAMLTQLELQKSLKRAEHLAGLVCQAEQQRKG